MRSAVPRFPLSACGGCCQRRPSTGRSRARDAPAQTSPGGGAPAVGTCLSPRALICSPNPGSMRAHTAAVASGVTSRGEGPVPPVVITRQQCCLSACGGRQVAMPPGLPLGAVVSNRGATSTLWGSSWQKMVREARKKRNWRFLMSWQVSDGCRARGRHAIRPTLEHLNSACRSSGLKRCRLGQ